MALFTLDTLNGNAFNKEDYNVESMMQLDAKISAFYMYFISIDSAKVRINDQWVPAAVYLSGTHRYIRYKKLTTGQKADCTPQAFYQFPEESFETLDFSRKPFQPETQASALTFKVDGLEVMCSKSRDYNICIFSMMVSDHFFQNHKQIFTPRSFGDLNAYVMDDHARRMGMLLDDNRLISFPIQRLGFVVIDEFSDVLEKGIMNKAEVRLQKKAENGRMVPCTLGTLRNQREGATLTMAAASNGYNTDYEYQGTNKIVMDHPIQFYMDSKAELYGSAEKKTLLYKFSAYGRRGIELHFTTDAEYYTMGNLLYRLIDACGGKPASDAGSGKNIGNTTPGNLAGTLADKAATAKKAEPETDPMEELNSLVGMDQLKKDVQELTSLVRMQKMREEKGMKAVPVTLHLVFTGNPGTGKTTVARILGKLYKQIGVLTKGQLVECDRSSLVAGYIGHTAIQTQKKIDEAMGGILFIDEAYTLAKEGNDFGQEAIDTLLKAMEDHRKDFVVIVAGYPDLMQKFINSNPGLKSRFNKYMNFPDYTAEELMKIFNSNCKKYDYVLEEEAIETVQKRIEKMVEEKDENFANAREVRNLFETIITNQASRVGKIDAPSDTDMVTITKEDVDND